MKTYTSINTRISLFTGLFFLTTFLLTSCITINTNEKPENIQTIFPELNTSANEETCLTLYPECHSWDLTSNFGGQNECFVGRVSKVFYELDDRTGFDMWFAYFDPNAARYPDWNNVSKNTTGLVIISVGSNISTYEGKCVAAFGKIIQSEDTTREARSMVDSFPDDNRTGFRLSVCNCP